MSSYSTRLRNNLPVTAAAILMLLAAVYRLPVAAGQMRLAMEFTFQVAAALALAALLWRRKQPYAALFLALALFSKFYPVYGRVSHLAFEALLYYFIWFALLVCCLRDGGEDALLSMMRVIALCNLLFIGLQLAGTDPLFISADGGKLTAATGMMANRNDLSALLCFCLPAFFVGRWRCVLPLMLGGLIAAKTVGGVLAAGAGLIFYAGIKGHLKLGAATVAIALAGYIFLVDRPTISQRWDLYEAAWVRIQQHWVFGYGLGHWKIAFPGHLFKSGFTVHNDFLQGWFDMGIFFPLIVAGYAVSVIRRFSRAAGLPATAAIMIAVSMMVGFPMQVAPAAMIAVAWAVILESRLERGIT